MRSRGLARVVVAAAITVLVLGLSPIGGEPAGAYLSDTKPSNLPDWSVRIPHSVQTLATSWMDPGFDSPRCLVQTFIVFDGQYAEIGFDTRPTATVWTQMPTTNIVGHGDDIRSPVATQNGGRLDWTAPSGHSISFGGNFGIRLGVYSPQVPTNDLGVRDCTMIMDQWIAEAEGYAANAILWSKVPVSNAAPQANFTWEVTDPATREVTFTNTSTDDLDPTDQLASTWEFGDETTSTDRHPVHQYPTTRTWPVTLTVKDQFGVTGSVTKQVTLTQDLVVNSTGDAPAVDPDAGCDTGDEVGPDDEVECTLRAALAAADADGGGRITFDIDAVGIPEIVATTALPVTTTDIVIDGTTQEGGWVAVRVGAAVGLQADDGTLEVRGLALSAEDTAVGLAGGSAHVLEGNRFGTDASGTTSRGQQSYSVAVAADDVTIEGNVIAGAAGVGTTGAGTRIVGNAIGVTEAGAVLGTTAVAVLALGSSVHVEDNVVVGVVAVSGADATGATITGNHVGVTRSGATIDAPHSAIRIDGSPDAAVSSNRVRSPGLAAIAVTGSVQSSTDDDGLLEFESPMSDPIDGPVTGGRTSIADNVIDGDGTGYGVAVWAGADEVAVHQNTVVNRGVTHVTVRGGSGHRITGNVLGSDAQPAANAISLDDVAAAVVGGAEASANQIVASSGGISVVGTSTDVQVLGNEVAAGGSSANLVGIRVGASVEGSLVSANTVHGGAKGVASAGDAAQVLDNVVDGAATVGVEALGDDVVVRGNVVVESGVGLAVGGDDVIVERNRVGITSGGTVVGNTSNGVEVRSGAAVVERNVVAGSGAAGIVVRPGAEADLRANRVWESEGPALAVADGPPTPTLLGAIRETGDDGQVRTTLVVADLPTEGGGRIEVFGNESCDDPEAQYLLEVTRQTRPNQTQRVILIRGSASRDDYTVTYTSPDGSTSNLSNCVSRDSHPDSDGDGAVDPLEEAFGFHDDPTRAVVVTEDERLLLVWAQGGGRLEQVELGFDPAPNSHPEGWELAYGALGFRVSDLAPGGETQVVLVSLEEGQTAGSSYWKYGPETPGGPTRWYRFDLDEQDGTGATQTVLTVEGQLRRAWVLFLRDGARGDSDGGANGTITDPGGPVLSEGIASPPLPVQPVIPTQAADGTITDPGGPVLSEGIASPPLPVQPVIPTQAAGGPVLSEGIASPPLPVQPVIPTQAAGGSGSGAGELPRTGVDPRPFVIIGVLLLALGTGLVASSRQRCAARR